MLDLHLRTILGILATLIGIVSYLPYFRDIYLGRTKPHSFSRLIWGVLMMIAFAGQLAGGAGPGAWATGFSALACFLIFLIAVQKGEQDITRGDWYCLIGAFAAIPLWLLTSTPLWSMILVTLIDLTGYIPTFRKSYARPMEETVSTYVLGALKHSIAIAALGQYSLVTVLYPLSLVLADAALAGMIMVRRSLLKKQVNN